MNPNPPIPLQTIQESYGLLARAVDVCLTTQLGAIQQLETQRDECLRFISLVQQHANLMETEYFSRTIENVRRMVRCLDDASWQSTDPPNREFGPTTSLIYTGRPGRPRIAMNPSILAGSLEHRGPTHLRKIFDCHPRTIRRRGLEYGILEPGDPVYIEFELDGDIQRIYTSSTGAQSDISDDALDETVRYILEAFPTFGRRMLDGHLKYLGHHVPRRRLRESYARVHGAPASAFGARLLRRRVYSVPGPNSLWHHDGQHGLIRWKIVIHAFIDGFSRLITGIRASDNNRAQTVLDLFEELIEIHGVPSRVRGDHGTENTLVAWLMESLQGMNRGSYIWGRSVHNIRIERLWRDLTLGFGHKWKEFFQGLEFHDGLNPNLPTHIWLLHHLFLRPINTDALEWAGAWNSHMLWRRGHRQTTPRDMFWFGMIQNGIRGEVDPASEAEHVENFEEYGIDWPDLEDNDILNHHDQYNVGDAVDGNPFRTHHPHHLSHIEVDVADSPFSPQQVHILNNFLLQLPATHSHSMDSHRLVWISALHKCEEIMDL